MINNLKIFILIVGLSIIWSSINLLVLGVILSLSTGLEISYTLGVIIISSAIGFLALLFATKKKLRFSFFYGFFFMVICLFVFSEGRFLGLEFGILSSTALLILSALNMFAISKCIENIDLKKINRLQFETIIIRVLFGFGLMFFISITLLPFYTMLMTSLKKQSDLIANPLNYAIDFSQGFTSLFSSYYELFSQFHFGQFILNSTIVSVLTVVITLIASIPGAYAVAKLRFHGKKTFSNSILMIYMVPAVVLIIPLYTVFSQLGLRDSLLGLLIVYPATTIPVALYMLQGYFKGIPDELEDAGLMDGCSRLGVIWRITLPLSLPAIASVSIYIFMIAWNEFLFAFMFLDHLDVFTLSRGVVSLNSSEVPRQYLMAGAVIVTIPVLAIFLWFEKFLVSGLTAGSVKG